MSLDSQIGSLVSAANNLTGEVAGKLQEIDQGLASGLQSLEAKVSQGFSGETRYCSPLGSDSTGDGTSSNPFKTIGKAVSSMYRNGTIYLMSGNHYWTKSIRLSNRNIEVQRAPGTNLEDVRLYPNKKENGNYADDHFFKLEASQVDIPNVHILTEGQATPSEKSSYRRCLAFAQNGFNVLKIGSASSDAQYTAKIDIEKIDDVLCRVARSALQVNLYKCDVTNMGTSSIEASGIEESGITTGFPLCSMGVGDRGTMIVSCPSSRLTNVNFPDLQYVGGFEIANGAAVA